MIFLYWLTLVVGAGAFLMSLIGHAIQTHDVVDLQIDAHDHFDWGTLFSVRNLTYLVFGFGATGVLLSLVWRGERDLLTALAALFTGGAAWLVSAVLFGYLRRSESGELQTDRTLLGRVGQVTLPMLPGGTGKVLVTRAGQTHELLAKPMAEGDAGAETWRSVVIVEMRDGVAFVTPYSEDPQS